MKRIRLLRSPVGRLAFTLTGIALAALLLAVPVTQAQIDPFRTRAGLEDVSPDLNRMARDAEACNPTSLQMPVSIYEAVSRALCSDPTVRESWANMLLNAAQVGVAKAAWLPTLDADGTRSHKTETQTISGPTFPDEIGRTSDRYAELKLSWVLFDFGRRDANLAYYKGLLELSQAAHTDTLQTVFEQAAGAFYAVWTAQSTLDAAIKAEANARRSYEIAQHKHLAGAGTLNDELQAKAAWQEAIYTRVNATGTLKTAQGTLCLRMGIPVETPIKIDVDAGAQPDVNFTSSISDLLALAEAVNPKLREAQAQIEADEANAKLALRQEMPTVSLSGSLSNDKSLGAFPRDTRTYSKYVGIQISIPIFAGFGDEYHGQASEAQVNIDRANLHKTELQVASAVWRNYQDVTTKTANVQVAASTEESAQEAYDVASKRYSAGVGPLLDVLNAQNTLAAAQRQVVQSRADWRVSRLVLAFSIGTLDGKRWTQHAEAP